MRISNDDIADAFERVADLLAAQDANPYRVRAYRGGARALRGTERSVAAILTEGGERALVALPGIGKSLAAGIRELVQTGRLALLQRLEGEVTPEGLLTTIPGIGGDLAHRIHDRLHVATLEELELAAHDGRLLDVPGLGPRRVRAIGDSVAAVLARAGRRRARVARRRATPQPVPAVELLLEVDAEYRRGAEAGTLRRIRPRRFNPEAAAWLPVLHTRRAGWELTAMYSNTARAHRLGTTRDWVVVSYERDGDEGQCTIVTEHHGPHAGERVVRGRERVAAGL